MKWFATVVLAASLVFAPAADARHRTYHRASQSYYGPSEGRHYVNSDGNLVHSPMRADRRPAGATARCRDRSWSFSQHARGTCSHHGGVAEWM